MNYRKATKDIYLKYTEEFKKELKKHRASSKNIF